MFFEKKYRIPTPFLVQNKLLPNVFTIKKNLYRQKFIFHIPGLIPGTKNGVFRYLSNNLKNLKIDTFFCHHFWDFGQTFTAYISQNINR